MKDLIIYYSLTGNCKFIAEKIADKIEADVLELKPKKEIKKDGFMKYLWGGRQIFMKESPELEPFNTNFNDYNLIIIGTPVWAWTFAPALQSFFDHVNLKNKKIALFCAYGGQPGKTIENMKKRLEGNEFVGDIGFEEPLKKMKVEDFQEELNKWLAKIKNFNLIDGEK